MRPPRSAANLILTRSRNLIFSQNIFVTYTSRGFCDKMHERMVIMPSIMNAKTGTIDKWLKKEGEEFTSMESLCEVTLSEENVSIALDTKRSGVLATILVQAGGTVAVGEPVAMFVDDKEEYFEHVENIRLATGDAEMMKEMTPDSHDAASLTNSQALLRQVKNMIKLGDIDDSTEFAKELQFLARKGNPDLLSIFEASCDNVLYNPETFDKKFFLNNAEEIVQESLILRKSSH